MHYKKRKLHKLHSIPIGLCNKEKLYLVSYSIPLSLLVVLLLTGIMAINPSLSLKTSAVTIQDEWVVKDSDSSSSSNSDYGSPASVKGENNNNNSNASTTSETSNNINIGSIDDSFGGSGGNNLELLQEDMDAGISPMSITAQPSLTLSIGKTTVETSTVQGGNTAYAANNVTLSGSYVKDYTLSIKASSTNLTMPNGASSSTSTISGAGDKTGDSMNANTWGYKLTETSTAESSYGTLNYASLPTTLTQIANGTVSSPYNLSANKKLVFAAKFSDTAAPGTYKGHITLSAVASQAVVGAIWSSGLETNITDMQDISSGFCKDNSKIAEGDIIELKDSRDSNSYTIVKLEDGNCWMQENLKLGGTSAMNLTPSNTNITSNYTLPAGTNSGSWNTSNYAVQQVRLGNTSWSSSWQTSWGNYYSWCAATAGTCSESTANNVNVSGSICPKGWHLPSGGSSDSTAAGVGQNSEFYKLLNGLNMSTIIASPYLFPAADYIYGSNGSLSNAGSVGRYWSRTSFSSYSAYSLIFDSSGFYPGTDNGTRYHGSSVRCVANY